MVHIDPEAIRRNPVLGVLLGSAAAAMMGWLLYSGWPEMRLLLAQRSPDRVSLHEAVNQRQARWVTTSEGRWERSADHVAILQVGASPRSALVMFLGLAATGVLGIGFAGCFLRLMLRDRERRSETLPAMTPIEPR